MAATVTTHELPAPFAWRGDHIEASLGTARGSCSTTRRGGVSAAPFASLNLPLDDDDPAAVAANRARVADRVGLPIAQDARCTARASSGSPTSPPAASRQRATARPPRCPASPRSSSPPTACRRPRGARRGGDGPRGLARPGRRDPRGGRPRAARARRRRPADRRDRARGRRLLLRGRRRGPRGVRARRRRRARADRPQGDRPRAPAARRRVTVHDVGLCTMCGRPALFFSHRRDRGRTGRQAGVAWRELVPA
jgi:hypothetical protein